MKNRYKEVQRVANAAYESVSKATNELYAKLPQGSLPIALSITTSYGTYKYAQTQSKEQHEETKKMAYEQHQSTLEQRHNKLVTEHQHTLCDLEAAVEILETLEEKREAVRAEYAQCWFFSDKSSYIQRLEDFDEKIQMQKIEVKKLRQHSAIQKEDIKQVEREYERKYDSENKRENWENNPSKPMSKM